MRNPKNLLGLGLLAEAPVLGPIPQELRAAGIADVVEATARAGLWSEREILEALDRGEGPRSKGAGADLASRVDLGAEWMMMSILRRYGYVGAIFGEELTGQGLVYDRSHEIFANLDGTDGTERAWRFTGGEQSAYGPCAGISLDRDGTIQPLRGATYMPRANRGYAGSSETGMAFQYRLKKRHNRWHFTELEQLEPFDPKRKDLIYSVGIWETKPGEGLEPWFGKLYSNANMYRHQLIPATSAGPDSLGNVIGNPIAGARPPGIGISANVSCRDFRLHDGAWAFPAMLALGGVVGNAQTGCRLGEEGFIPETGTLCGKTYHGGLRGLKAAGLVAELPIGPLISAQNQKLFDTAREYMGC
jgi:hypothetical protein